MAEFRTKLLPVEFDSIAPDGSEVRLLLDVEGGGMAHFRLESGHTSLAVTHQTVDEIWFILSGRGEMWRRNQEQEEVVVVEPGVCLTIPVGTHFQFRARGSDALTAIGVTMPPWPGQDEAMVVQGKWEFTVG